MNKLEASPIKKQSTSTAKYNYQNDFGHSANSMEATPTCALRYDSISMTSRGNSESLTNSPTTKCTTSFIRMRIMALP